MILGLIRIQMILKTRTSYKTEKNGEMFLKNSGAKDIRADAEADLKMPSVSRPWLPTSLRKQVE